MPLPPTAPDLAALDEAITAICANGLLQDHGLSWSATLGDVKSAMFAAHVTPPNAVLDIPLGQIATHTAGMKPDLTQGEMLTDKHGSLGLHNRISLSALRPEGTKGTRGKYFYSNTNCTVLGSLIEGLGGTNTRQVLTSKTPSGNGGALVAHWWRSPAQEGSLPQLARPPETRPI
ncbi:serine hydrolase [Pseudogemmobacter sp. W21_MBD1_M6]|uniref:serine hydrolase n=1 Tax=Pseudogemmobacter sp. W21_MBD1_M6 TaxID=3240271 RepID=UPI003F99C5C2